MPVDLDAYLQAADRENTVRSYASAVKHFEETWRGLLPATPDTIARYLVEHAEIHRLSTLRQRLAGLSRWHADHGFADPTRSVLIRRVMRGIRAKHAAPQRRAKPLELDVMESVSIWLLREGEEARQQGRRAVELRTSRDRSMLLMGFWRAFRADELANMRFEEVDAARGDGLTFRPRRTKTTTEDEARAFYCPALSRLCPVDAFLDWKALSGRAAGPVYPAIDRWGNVSTKPMKPATVIPLLRRIFTDAGAEEAANYSSHSLRRGFAQWAHSSGWDLKELMEHVGWRDVSSAMRYIDVGIVGVKKRFETSLARSLVSREVLPIAANPDLEPDPNGN